MLAQTHSKKWQKSLQYERDQRIRLEETLEQLAKQHNHLERAFRGATVLPANTPGSTGSGKGKTLGPRVACSHVSQAVFWPRWKSRRLSRTSDSCDREPDLLPPPGFSTAFYHALPCSWFARGKDPGVPGLGETEPQ